MKKKIENKGEMLYKTVCDQSHQPSTPWNEKFTEKKKKKTQI